MAIKYKYTVSNVHVFNDMLDEVCRRYNCLYLDCFRYFLSSDGREFCSALYYDWVHLNNAGIGVLAQCYKKVMSNNSFNYVIHDFAIR